jgi:hypothetical protein
VFVKKQELEQSTEKQFMIWDLKRDMACPGHIVGRRSDACFHRVNNKHTIVYAAKVKAGGSNVIESTLDQFSLDMPMKQLKSGNLHINIDIGYIQFVYQLNSLRILLAVYAPDTSIHYLVHEVPDGEEANQRTVQFKVPAIYIVIPLLLQGYGYFVRRQWLLNVNDDINYSKIIYWPNTIRCRHAIGNICFIEGLSGGTRRYEALVDMSTPEIIRYFEPIDGYTSRIFVMTVAISLNNQRNEA